jgi:hypothetical protein
VLAYLPRAKQVALLAWQLLAQCSTWCVEPSTLRSSSWLQMGHAFSLAFVWQALKAQLAGYLLQSALR